MFHIARLLACFLALALTATAAVADDPPQDERIKISVTKAPKPEASKDAPAAPAKPADTPAGTAEGEKSPADRMAEAPRLSFAYDGEPFREVLADLSERLNVIIICRDEKALNRAYHRHMEVPEPMAMRAVCGHLLLEPRPAYIICKEDEVRDNEKLPVVKAKDLLVDLEVADVPLEDVLEALGKSLELNLSATDALCEKAVTCNVTGARVEDLLTTLATQAEGALTTGYVLQQIQIGKGLEELEAMPAEDLEKAVRGFLDGAKKATADNPQMGSMISGNVQSGMMDAVKMFNDLEPEEQTWVVQKGSEAITRVGGVMKRLSPETQTELKQLVKPYLGLVLVGYMRMPSQTRAKIGPLMQAINGLGW